MDGGARANLEVVPCGEPQVEYDAVILPHIDDERKGCTPPLSDGLPRTVLRSQLAAVPSPFLPTASLWLPRYLLVAREEIEAHVDEEECIHQQVSHL